MTSDYMSIWAKTVPEQADPTRARFHPLIYHLLDVAAVAEAVLAQSPEWLALASRLSLSEKDLARFLVFCCALHDISKCSLHFQSREPDLWPGGRSGAWPRERLTERSHGEITALYLLASDKQPVAPLLRAVIGTGAAKIVSAIAGLHGRPLAILADSRDTN